MDKYNWLMRRREKALRVFHKARAKLEGVLDQLQTEIAANRDEVGELHKEIGQRHSEIAYLEFHKAAVDQQHQKIKALLE